MEIICKNCSTSFEGRGKYCLPCRPIVYRQQRIDVTKRWVETHSQQWRNIQLKSKMKPCLRCGTQRQANGISLCRKCKTEIRLFSLPPKPIRKIPTYLSDPYSSFREPFREDWLTIPEWEMYSINSQGIVRDERTNKVRAWGSHPKGYAVITLQETKNRKKAFSIHSLVAQLFISPKPSRYHQVNHRDLHKLNNSVSNLEWVTSSENNQHYRNSKL